MQSFKTLLQSLKSRMATGLFPGEPGNLYEPADYILKLGGKRIRPVLCLMGNELFDDIREDAYQAAIAIEMFHNFTLVHDDIMDEAPIRRGKPTVHCKYGSSSALLAGDVMLVQAYDTLNQIKSKRKANVFNVFSRTAREVCEGQQLDMDLAELPLEEVKMEDYLRMITLKTSVLLAGSLQIGGLIGEGGEEDLKNLYEFGKKVGIAFQVQDDYLDAFGDPEKFGKQTGGDILSDKKTFLLVKAYELADETQKSDILSLLACKDPNRKIEGFLDMYKKCHIDEWAREQKKRLVDEAGESLRQVQVVAERKQELKQLMEMLLNRER